MDVMQRAKQALEEYAAPNEDLGWPGDPLLAANAEEVAGFLSERCLLAAD